MSSPSDAAAPLTDALGRTPIAEGMKRQIAEAFTIVPPGKRSALLVFHDFETGETTAQLAAKFGEHWKVAGGPRFKWDGHKPAGWVGVQAAW